MKAELVTKTIGVGRYENLSPGEIIEAVARHGTIKDYGKLITYLVKKAHWSPLEHVHYGFRVETSRAISAQIFRHKSLHFQEQSQRYDEILEFEGVQIRKQAEKNRQSSEEEFNPFLRINSNIEFTENPANRALEKIKLHLSRTKSLYNQLLDANVAKECARMILPMTSKTVVHITGNVRDLFAFLNVRCDHHAQKEIRDIALAVGEILEKEMPEVMTKINWREGMFMN